MKDWGKELFNEWAYTNFIPSLLEKVKEYTGCSGELKVRFRSFLHRESKDEIVIEKPKCPDSPWDLFFYSWLLVGKALYLVDSQRPLQANIPILSRDIALSYMQDNYPEWYKKNKRVIGAIVRNLNSCFD